MRTHHPVGRRSLALQSAGIPNLQQVVVVRTVSGVTQPTVIERFRSLDVLEIREGSSVVQLKHGGNIFFRQTPSAVQNRLWCYDEFCDRFYWAASMKA